MICCKQGEILNNKFGSFYHNDIIGKPFGSKINSRCSNGYVYILAPTPELWSSAVYVRKFSTVLLLIY